MQNYKQMSANRLWLYFVGLKLFGTKNNWCLNYASSRSSGLCDLISNVYRCILNKNVKSADFWNFYESRKILLNQTGNPSAELTAYCKVVVGKGKNAIYYLNSPSITAIQLGFFSNNPSAYFHCSSVPIASFNSEVFGSFCSKASYALDNPTIRYSALGKSSFL